MQETCSRRVLVLFSAENMVWIPSSSAPLSVCVWEAVPFFIVYKKMNLYIVLLPGFSVSSFLFTSCAAYALGEDSVMYL